MAERGGNVCGRRFLPFYQEEKPKSVTGPRGIWYVEKEQKLDPTSFRNIREESAMSDMVHNVFPR